MMHCIFNPGSKRMEVTPDPNTRIVITSTTPEPDCSVCKTVDSKQQCSTRQLRLSDPSSVEFTCPKPQDVFSVEINRELGTELKNIYTVYLRKKCISYKCKI